uniref:Ribosomal protein S14 n=1 Tax=Spondias tuberosa TaxID=991123 RepID=A0A5C2FR82_9ROSI|nr:ribosomal protein S14 [Spondias tuberosa]QEP09157.1 ribosomal protein S14 [Spondias tuberosa]
MSEKRNIRDHKRRLLATKYELRRKLYKIESLFFIKKRSRSS